MPRPSSEERRLSEIRLAEAELDIEEMETRRKLAKIAQEARDALYREQLAKSTPYNPGSKKHHPRMMQIRQIGL